MTTGAQKPPARSSDVRMVALNLSAKELVFLQKVTRQEYHFITDDEQQARLKLRDKLVEASFDQERGRVVLNLSRDELLFLIKVARENYSFIARAEKEARLALAAKLHKTAESVFGVTTARGLTRRCGPSSSGRRATSTTARARSCARSPAPTPTGCRKRRSAASRSTWASPTWSSAEGVMASFVDVPGHERFVRNMLAGAHGIVAVLLVVAADESVMPQTREHFHICRLLGVPRGLVALTKCDAADAESQATAALETAELVTGSFLDGAPVRARLGPHRRGAPRAAGGAAGAGAGPPPPPAEGLLRLPIDRVFSMKGFGDGRDGNARGGHARRSTRRSKSCPPAVARACAGSRSTARASRARSPARAPP